jgi:hypothetical protein
LGWARDGDGNAVTLERVSYVRIDVLSGRTQIDAVSVVPEPSIGALSLIAVLALWLKAGKRKTEMKPC